MSASRPWEELQRELDAERDLERDRVAESVAATLRARGVELTGSENAGQLADLLSAVEQFEAAVSEIGGDRMMNDPYSSQPEDQTFVLPRRAADESPRQYADRVLRSAWRLRKG